MLVNAHMTAKLLCIAMRHTVPGSTSSCLRLYAISKGLRNPQVLHATSGKTHKQPVALGSGVSQALCIAGCT